MTQRRHDMLAEYDRGDADEVEEGGQRGRVVESCSDDGQKDNDG